MIFTITDDFGQSVSLTPRLELYSVYDFFGIEMPGLAIVLDVASEDPAAPAEGYAVLTVSFGEFISLRNSAYIDTNNCRFAQQILDLGIAKDTGFKKCSGFCEYPLWVFDTDFLKEIGGENYKKYSEAYDTYKSIF